MKKRKRLAVVGGERERREEKERERENARGSEPGRRDREGQRSRVVRHSPDLRPYPLPASPETPCRPLPSVPRAPTLYFVTDSSARLSQRTRVVAVREKYEGGKKDERNEFFDGLFAYSRCESACVSVTLRVWICPQCFASASAADTVRYVVNVILKNNAARVPFSGPAKR